MHGLRISNEQREQRGCEEDAKAAKKNGLTEKFFAGGVFTWEKKLHFASKRLLEMTSVDAVASTSTMATSSSAPAIVASNSVDVDTGRIIDKILKKEQKKEIYYSFEYFPPKVDEGMFVI